jgi:hypothetical protein
MILEVLGGSEPGGSFFHRPKTTIGRVGGTSRTGSS